MRPVCDAAAEAKLVLRLTGSNHPGMWKSRSIHLALLRPERACGGKRERRRTPAASGRLGGVA